MLDWTNAKDYSIIINGGAKYSSYLWLINETQEYCSEACIPKTLNDTEMPSQETRTSRNGEYTKRHLNTTNECM
jgi:hypothetical protein